ncbi:MAG TPA: hypothetical protein H9759_07805 [Candidatus Dietzia intestinipullorum]|nr:hypothetical protein [Candidatus Dietzia intestinipullorum]
MSMQPYQPNSIELKKQQVRKDAKVALIASGVTVVSLPIALFASSFFTVVAILAGIVAVYKGVQVRNAIKGPDA